MKRVPTERDYGKLFPRGACAICAQPRSPDGYESHAALHLGTGEAVTVRAHGVTSVVPNTGTDVPTVGTLPRDFYRSRDKALVRIVRAALKKAGAKT